MLFVYECFLLLLFSCTSCGCNSAGTLPGGGCDLINGTCFCKAFVRGGQCSECVAGYVNLEVLNPLGCSAGMFSDGGGGASCSQPDRPASFSHFSLLLFMLHVLL